MTVKVEIGFTEEGQGAPYFTLDDQQLGKLDQPGVFLGGGEVFADVTAFFQNYTIRRGKSRELDRFQAGQGSVTFENDQRTFDPTFEASPFAGQIVPKRSLRITNQNQIQFLGIIEDWNISYDPGGQSIAVCQAFDLTGYFSNLDVPAATFPAQNTGDRINEVLDAIGWSQTQRDIDATGAELVADSISGVRALEYLQLVAGSEPGDLFISKSGAVKLTGRNRPFTSDGITLSDGLSGPGPVVPYKTITAIFGSELLYNRVTVTSPVGTAVATNQTSINIYGERDLEEATLLDSQVQLDTLSEFFVQIYGEPEYRFEKLTVDLQAVNAQQKDDLLALELGDVVEVIFTPNKIPPAIERYAKVISLNQTISNDRQEIEIGLQTSDSVFLVLDDAIFGKLDSANTLGW